MSIENQIIDANQGTPVPRALPNASAVLVLGILSIVCCICYGILSLTLSIVALVLASKDGKLYSANPSAYTQGSYNNLQAGRICAIIGLSLSALFIIYIIWVFITIGSEQMTNWNYMMNSK